MTFLESSESYFADETFKIVRADTPITLYSKDFDTCTFENCTLAEITFNGCKFQDCTFKNCDLSLAKIPDTAFVETQFHDCKLIGINWTDAAWTLLSSLHFYDCNISHSTFVDLKLQDGHIYQCKAENCDFSGTELLRFDCQKTDFLESRFVECNLTDADFTGAQNYSIHTGENTLKHTKFSLPEAISLLRSLDIILVDEES